MSARVETAVSGRLLTVDDVAERWSVPRAHVYRLARDGRVPSVRIGRYVRFTATEIERFERAGGSASE